MMSSTTPVPTLFTAKQVGLMQLKHRIVFAPSTRYRCDNEHVPLPHVAEYYRQRTSVPGSLVIAEPAYIAAKCGGTPNVPGIWSKAQIDAWKKVNFSLSLLFVSLYTIHFIHFIQVTDGVHANNSYIYLQIWAQGRAAFPENLEKEGPFPYVSASNIAMSDGRPAPRPLTTDEIKEYISLFAQAAKNAIEAGFDGVELHGANGYLIDQFIKEVTNKRTDEYGGSVEGRARFPLEIIDAVTKAVGEERTGLRISPWGTYNGKAVSLFEFTY
jgi:NADPH2 dehydrogenase